MQRIITLLPVALLVPLIGFAQDMDWLESFALGIELLISLLVPLLIGIALLVFIWGLVIFIKNSGDEKMIEEGKMKMKWGIVGLFVIVTVWGLVALVITIVGITPGDVVAPGTI